MKKLLLFVLASCLLSGCSLFQIQRNDIRQGNVITQEEVSKLHVGMTESQVKEVMGTPVFVNIFSNNRFDYVYTYQPGHGQLTETRVTCYFSGGRLSRIERS